MSITQPFFRRSAHFLTLNPATRFPCINCVNMSARNRSTINRHQMSFLWLRSAPGDSSRYSMSIRLSNSYCARCWLFMLPSCCKPACYVNSLFLYTLLHTCDIFISSQGHTSRNEFFRTRFGLISLRHFNVAWYNCAYTSHSLFNAFPLSRA